MEPLKLIFVPPPPGEPINLMEILDPHTVAGLLKYHFREWRVSIIPRGKPLEEVTAAVKNKDVSESIIRTAYPYWDNGF